jgi:hypothetical protein
MARINLEYQKQSLLSDSHPMIRFISVGPEKKPSKKFGVFGFIRVIRD